ncbi:MAG: aldehyde dehydrogenase family protein [Cocleimonas sp.]|nr:aldehyde dehydrogenase family protein [Cocleimonas sp.]
MKKVQQTKSPIDGSIYIERTYASPEDATQIITKAAEAHKHWRKLSVDKRASYCNKAVDAFIKNKEAIGEEITKQMGRPIRYAAGEVAGFEERARYMISIAKDKLADTLLDKKEGFERFIRRESLGVVFTVAPWNYPYLTAVNSIIPALMAGNTVILKHSAQTPLCAERLADAFEEAGLPEGIFQIIHATHETVAGMIKNPDINYIAFTGSVTGGESIEASASGLFKGVGLELGGKDPAYVRADADIPFSVENLVDGVYFNSGQSCCGVERIYVHKDVFEPFVDGFKKLVEGYVLGDPMDEATTLGPMVKSSAAFFVREQIEDAIDAGATALIDTSKFPMDVGDSPYLAPQVLINVDRSMRIMTQESFGPVVGIQQVENDEEALQLMNDSEYGLTASIWTNDKDKALELADDLETGTCFMNRCDYLDPELAWVGVKNSGRGCTLSSMGYESLTRPKSFHLRTDI